MTMTTSNFGTQQRGERRDVRNKCNPSDSDYDPNVDCEGEEDSARVGHPDPSATKPHCEGVSKKPASRWSVSGDEALSASRVVSTPSAGQAPLDIRKK